MTKERLKDILYPLAFKGAGKVNTEDALQAMKQAVNEALEEVISNTDQFDHIHKDEILNLKVK